MTPAAVHYGRADELNAARRQVLVRSKYSNAQRVSSLHLPQAT